MQILMLTGYGSIPTAVEAVKMGAVNYLAKPVDVDTILANFGSEGAAQSIEVTPSRMSLKRLEWEHIQRVLEEHDGNISAAARSLNMHRRTLQRKLQKRPVKQ
jgi:two-component system response regulator RegA